jgi:hypothetical protein
MPTDPATDLGGVVLTALVEPPVLVATRRRLALGLGMTQQHQTAHGIVSIRVRPGQSTIRTRLAERGNRLSLATSAGRVCAKIMLEQSCRNR